MAISHRRLIVPNSTPISALSLSLSLSLARERGASFLIRDGDRVAVREEEIQFPLDKLTSQGRYLLRIRVKSPVMRVVVGDLLQREYRAVPRGFGNDQDTLRRIRK